MPLLAAIPVCHVSKGLWHSVSYSNGLNLCSYSNACSCCPWCWYKMPLTLSILLCHSPVHCWCVMFVNKWLWSHVLLCTIIIVLFTCCVVNWGQNIVAPIHTITNATLHPQSIVLSHFPLNMVHDADLTFVISLFHKCNSDIYQCPCVFLHWVNSPSNYGNST